MGLGDYGALAERLAPIAAALVDAAAPPAGSRVLDLAAVPGPAVALGELCRVLVPGGGLAGFTAWTSDGFIGAMTELMRG